MNKQNNEDLRKGVPFAVLAVLFVSMQPIILLARPGAVDWLLFAGMTCVMMMLIVFPLLIIETKNIRANPETEKPMPLEAWSKNKKVLIYIGINFAVAQALFVLAYQLSSAVEGSLAQQTSIIFAVLLGFLILHEKISKIQIIFALVLLFGLTLAITQGTFSLIRVNIGVLIMVFTAMLWMLAHCFTKPLLDENKITPIQLVFIRNLISGTALMITYIIFFPVANLSLIIVPLNLFFIVAMGAFYAFAILCWYKCLKHIDVSKATIIVAPMPLLTALLAFMILGETYTIFHLIGTLIVISSIIIIVREEANQKKEKNTG